MGLTPLELNQTAVMAQQAIRMRFPNDTVNLYRECDKNVYGEFSAHAWGRAVDHWGQGLFKKSHMDFTADYALKHAEEWHLQRLLYRGYAYDISNGWEPEPLPPEVAQHFDHVHFQFFPLTYNEEMGYPPPGCDEP